MIGYVYLQHGDAANAASVLESVHAVFPQDREICRLLAYALLRLGRFQECLDLTDFLLSGHGTQEPLHVWLFRSRALYGLGKHREAQKLWKQIRKGGR